MVRTSLVGTLNFTRGEDMLPVAAYRQVVAFIMGFFSRYKSEEYEAIRAEFAVRMYGLLRLRKCPMSEYQVYMATITTWWTDLIESGRMQEKDRTALAVLLEIVSRFPDLGAEGVYKVEAEIRTGSTLYLPQDSQSLRDYLKKGPKLQGQINRTPNITGDPLPSLRDFEGHTELNGTHLSAEEVVLFLMRYFYCKGFFLQQPVTLSPLLLLFGRAESACLKIDVHLEEGTLIIDAYYLSAAVVA